MKKLTLKTAAYRFLEQSFAEWLDILGYAPSTVQAFPTHVREFLHYLETHNHTHINQIDIPIIKTYYNHLSQRANQRLGGGLSNNYLNQHLSAIEKLLDYLRKQGRILLPPTGIPLESPNPQPITPLTTEQVKQLYQGTTTYEDEYPELASRDRALLAIFYDCGLRRNEGVNLNYADIHFDNRLLQVRHAKGGKPRFVPFSRATGKYLEHYRYDARPQLLSPDKSGEEAFFIGRRGNRANGNTLNTRLKQIQKHTDCPILQQKPLHLHILRHSIATHLLYQGMSIEKVSQFLGHQSLESTQVYTHLIEKVYG